MNRPAPIVFALLLLATAGLAAMETGDLGSLDFPNSGAPEAQEAFVRGVLLLHSFEFEDAEEAFREARRIDPEFAMAYWGEAMTHNHPLWREQDRDAALAVLAEYAPTPEQRAAKAPTDRERAYLAAIDILYGEGDKVERDLAYSEAMGEIAATWPEDLEARAFYALSILGTTQGKRDFSVYMRAGAVAEEVFAANRRHPGAIHYMIHSYDDPIHAPLGLRAARVYNEIAPAASHAQHMISHIFVALGRWEDSVESNVKAYEVSEQRREAKGLPLDSLNYHALHWLQYSYLQLGQSERARRILERMRGFAEESGTSRAVWHYAVMRAMWHAETAREAPPALDRSMLRLGGVATDLFGEGYAAVRSGDVEAARAALAELEERYEADRAEADDDAETGSRGMYAASAHPVQVMAKSLAALIVLAEGDEASALDLLDEATALEASMPLEYGPPDIVKPSHELYGEVLLGLGQPAEAMARFEAALERAPRRTASLLGLARAAAATGDLASRDDACSELASILAESDGGGSKAEVCERAASGVAP